MSDASMNIEGGIVVEPSKPAIATLKREINEISPKFEAIPQPQTYKVTNREITPPGTEIAPTVDKYAENRQKLRSYMERKGNILPSDHEFTQLVQRVSERLGVPEQTELMVVDTEELDAFFHPESRTIAFTRGFSRYFLEQGLELSEDHIAAVLGHELEHAHVIGDDYVERVQSSYFERLKSAQNHAEEYRADAEAMRRLSRAGYNPQAVIEMLRTFPLTHGRGDLGHPEQIDRIRKLEDRLADDEHPLSHTAQDKTPINPELLAWFAGDSEIYNRTEELLHRSPQELTQALLETGNQADFWTTYSYQQHVERIAGAKELSEKEAEALERLLTKAMVYEAFVSHTKFSEGKPIKFDIMVHKELLAKKAMFLMMKVRSSFMQGDLLVQNKQRRLFKLASIDMVFLLGSEVMKY